jgi:hypothetical protein
MGEENGIMKQYDRETSIVEPISIKNTKPDLSISLRGSLAGNYFSLVDEGKDEEANNFINTLLSSNNADLIKFKEEKSIVIGLKSEKRKFFPDW